MVKKIIPLAMCMNILTVLRVLALLIFTSFLCAQGVLQQELDVLEDEINMLLKKNGHEYITVIIKTDNSGIVEVQTYFLQDLGNLEIPSKMTLVATLVGNMTADRKWPSSRLIFFETQKDIYGWISIEDCREALKVENFKERIDFVLSKLKRD